MRRGGVAKDIMATAWGRYKPQALKFGRKECSTYLCNAQLKRLKTRLGMAAFLSGQAVGSWLLLEVLQSPASVVQAPKGCTTTSVEQ